jgi:hypothetical protein
MFEKNYILFFVVERFKKGTKKTGLYTHNIVISVLSAPLYVRVSYREKYFAPVEKKRRKK